MASPVLVDRVLSKFPLMTKYIEQNIHYYYYYYYYYYYDEKMMVILDVHERP